MIITQESAHMIRIDIGHALMSSVEPALLRLNYLYPAIEFRLEENTICATMSQDIDLDALKQQIFYTIYRENIARRGQSLRDALIAALES